MQQCAFLFKYCPTITSIKNSKGCTLVQTTNKGSSQVAKIPKSSSKLYFSVHLSNNYWHQTMAVHRDNRNTHLFGYLLSR